MPSATASREPLCVAGGGPFRCGGMASPSDRSLYKFEREIGRGSYGRVYRARRRSDGREVAVKVMLLQARLTIATKAGARQRAPS